ncbi:DNA-processing protein DprA [Succinivibrio dextrinosolvens]|uniref:DNA-processing protein DprA n=1 Tax=Succinivibrio dextrinosolvens TaxID=83771 RepID=UPI001923D874|nr:DNA-processing protein DprA [Succinivibrio dextrinosolvens]
MTKDYIKNILAISFIKGIGPSKLKDILNIIKNDVLSEKDIYELLEKYSKNKKTIILSKDYFNAAIDQAQRQLELAEKYNIGIICREDPLYPTLLKKSAYDPAIIFYKGNLNALPSRYAAVIGTRNPTEHGAIIAQRIATYLAENKFSIVSGLAIGCDSIAHKAALDVNGHTIAVLAHGLDSVFPNQNKELAEQIIDNGGLLISTYGIGEKPSAYTFAARDKIQSGLSEFVVMIQSGVNGGSLIASQAALADGRKLIIPRPTQRDLDNKEANIEANSILIEAPIKKTFANLKGFNFKDNQIDNYLKNIVTLNNKFEYKQAFNITD